MKKLIFLIFTLFVLCACSAEASVSNAEVAKAYFGEFSAEVKAEFGGAVAEMTAAKKPISISILLNSPGEVAGMGIELFDEHAVVSYEGMTEEINTDNLPDGTVFLLLEELFEELADPEEFDLSTEGNALRAQNEDFTALLNSESFALISAEFPRYKTKFTFSEFAFGTPQ